MDTSSNNNTMIVHSDSVLENETTETERISITYYERDEEQIRYVINKMNFDYRPLNLVIEEMNKITFDKPTGTLANYIYDMFSLLIKDVSQTADIESWYDYVDSSIQRIIDLVKQVRTMFTENKSNVVFLTPTPFSVIFYADLDEYLDTSFSSDLDIRFVDFHNTKSGGEADMKYFDYAINQIFRGAYKMLLENLGPDAFVFPDVDTRFPPVPAVKLPLETASGKTEKEAKKTLGLDQPCSEQMKETFSLRKESEILDSIRSGTQSTGNRFNKFYRSFLPMQEEMIELVEFFGKLPKKFIYDYIVDYLIFRSFADEYGKLDEGIYKVIQNEIKKLINLDTEDTISFQSARIEPESKLHPITTAYTAVDVFKLIEETVYRRGYTYIQRAIAVKNYLLENQNEVLESLGTMNLVSQSLNYKYYVLRETLMLCESLIFVHGKIDSDFISIFNSASVSDPDAKKLMDLLTESTSKARGSSMLNVFLVFTSERPDDKEGWEAAEVLLNLRIIPPSLLSVSMLPGFQKLLPKEDWEKLFDRMHNAAKVNIPGYAMQSALTKDSVKLAEVIAKSDKKELQRVLHIFLDEYFSKPVKEGYVDLDAKLRGNANKKNRGSFLLVGVYSVTGGFSEDPPAPQPYMIVGKRLMKALREVLIPMQAATGDSDASTEDYDTVAIFLRLFRDQSGPFLKRIQLTKQKMMSTDLIPMLGENELDPINKIIDSAVEKNNLTPGDYHSVLVQLSQNTRYTKAKSVFGIQILKTVLTIAAKKLQRLGLWSLHDQLDFRIRLARIFGETKPVAKSVLLDGFEEDDLIPFLIREKTTTNAVPFQPVVDLLRFIDELGLPVMPPLIEYEEIESMIPRDFDVKKYYDGTYNRRINVEVKDLNDTGVADPNEEKKKEKKTTTAQPKVHIIDRRGKSRPRDIVRDRLTGPASGLPDGYKTDGDVSFYAYNKKSGVMGAIGSTGTNFDAEYVISRPDFLDDDRYIIYMVKKGETPSVKQKKEKKEKEAEDKMDVEEEQVEVPVAPQGRNLSDVIHSPMLESVDVAFGDTGEEPQKSQERLEEELELEKQRTNSYKEAVRQKNDELTTLRKKNDTLEKTLAELQEDMATTMGSPQSTPSRSSSRSRILVSEEEAENAVKDVQALMSLIVAEEMMDITGYNGKNLLQLSIPYRETFEMLIRIPSTMKLLNTETWRDLYKTEQQARNLAAQMWYDPRKGETPQKERFFNALQNAPFSNDAEKSMTQKIFSQSVSAIARRINEEPRGVLAMVLKDGMRKYKEKFIFYTPK